MQEKLRTEIRSAAKAASEAALQPLRKRIDDMQNSLQESTAKFVAIEVDDWINKEVYVNAIVTQMQYLRLIRKIDHPDGYYLNDGLDKLQQIFRKAINHEHHPRLDAFVIAEITQFFDIIEKENPIVVARLRELLAELTQ